MTTTPWGKRDHSQKVARGIMWYSTPSHGGYHLSQKRLEEMPEPYKSFKTFAGKGWYEEDCDWALVVLSFPEEFKKCYGEEKYQDVNNVAMNTLQVWKPYFKMEV
jgi:hypothetical protein